MNGTDLLNQFHEIAANPAKQLHTFLARGKKVVLTAPIYTPEEIIHAMGIVPMGAWGADIQLNTAKQYFPSFICSVLQSILELGMRGAYDGADAIVIPSLSDSLKALGENWKYAVPGIPFIPVMYPQNRDCEAGFEFTQYADQRVIDDLERITGKTFKEENLAQSIKIYNRHNGAMRALSEALADRPEIGPAARSDIFKSAFFTEKEVHTQMVEAFLATLGEAGPDSGKLRIVTSGVLADSPALNRIFQENRFHIVGDDVAAESRQYATDAPQGEAPLEAMALKYRRMNNCAFLYDPEKRRVEHIVQLVRARKADGVLILLAKFCDPEAFDYPLIKKACEQAGISIALIETDRQTQNYEQAATMVLAFSEMIEAKK